MMSTSPNYQYQPGGSLPPDSPTYVTRQADTDLYNHLRQGRYCYVLNSRQMGKSSLRVHTMHRLQAAGIACAEVELSGIGSQQITALQWYGGIIQELISGFGLKINRRSWLKEHDDLSPIQRLSSFIETVLLQQVQQQIVVFIDEIDSVLGLDFSTDDFFGFLRNCYERRAKNPEYQRLAFVLLGVATPSDLIQNERSTPFNIGQAIELRGIQPDESYPLVKGLENIAERPLALLKRVLYWTGGQPFLTQKLCWLVSLQQEKINAGREYAVVDKLVKDRLINNWEGQDEPEHLRTIRDRLVRNSPRSVQLLKLYRQILRRGQIPAQRSPEHLELRLSGLIIQEQGSFRIFNQLYRTIFNQSWIDQSLRAKEPGPRRLQWWKAAIVSLVTLTSLIGLRHTGTFWNAELQLYDQMLRLRPDEGPDPRLLIIEITAADVKAQEQQERVVASLSDSSLNQLLIKLDQGNPRAIGLDIYRDYPASTKLPQLTQNLKTNDRLIAICNYADPTDPSQTGVAAPPEIRSQYQGFNNVPLDQDRVLRRHLLAVGKAEPCGNKYAFSIRLTEQYLDAKNIQLAFTDNNELQFDSIVLKPLVHNAMGYRATEVKGHQVMLNYRSTPKVASTVTLREVLQPDFNLKRLENKIILIGTTDPSFQDVHWQTPYSAGHSTLQTMAGVEIQAHMVSQLISSVIDGRRLIAQSPILLDIVLLIISGVLGGTIAYLIRSPALTLVCLGTGTCIFFAGGFMWLIIGGLWVSTATAIGILLVTATTTRIAIHLYQRQPQLEYA